MCYFRRINTVAVFHIVAAIKDKELLSTYLESLLKATHPELVQIIAGGGGDPVFNDEKVVGGKFINIRGSFVKKK